MCGIAGRVGPSAGSREVVKAMTDSLIHRGPDEEGFFVANGVELGSRRLAIIDVAESHQPIVLDDRSIVVVFNGEVYNFKEIRNHLMAQGCQLNTEGDTEVIAHLYKIEGLRFLERLRGMFAIALWDSKERTLILARDRLGEKPLLFRENSDGGIDFASEAKSLLLGNAVREPDFQALDFVMAFGYAPPPMTGFKGISALAPGQMLIWKLGKVRFEQYWKFKSSEKDITELQDAMDRTRDLLDESVSMRLISERPLGIFLSGGIDSTLVAAMAVKNSSQQIRTYSIGFKDPAFDESKYAARVARHLGTEHHELIVEPDPELLVRTMASTLDRPFADSSILPTFMISQFARTEVVVALGGDGGDEVFGGYTRYQRLERLHARNSLLRLASPASALFASGHFRDKSPFLSRASHALRAYSTKWERYMALQTLITPSERSAIWNVSNFSEAERPTPAQWFHKTWDGVESRGNLDQSLAMDIETYLPEDLNFKTDIASMANSLELRAPFQDHKLVELGGRIASDLKFRNGETKYILKKLAEEFVPSELVYRKKMGFGIPRASWMRNELRPLVNEVLLGSRARDRGWFEQEELRRQISLHNHGFDRDRLLWPLMAIELWAQNWLD